MKKNWLIQVSLFFLATACLVSAGLLRQPARKGRENIADIARTSKGGNPDLAVLTVMPGAVRALALNSMWIRMQRMYRTGQYYDAYELSRLICDLQPHYAGAWGYCGWHMAWNVSVKAKTAEERWKWVYGGIGLLRDEGLPRNPHDLIFYKELGWIYQQKIGGMMDNYHWSYRARWAKMMQDLLGAPPVNVESDISMEESTKRAIDSFRPVADAPLDKSPEIQADEMVQSRVLNRLLTEYPELAKLVDKLGKLGVSPDENFLDACNRLGMDVQFSSVRSYHRPHGKEGEQKLFKLINSPEYRLKDNRYREYTGWENLPAFEKLLSFIRAQLLWNRYRLDPDFMLKLMEEYKAPIDWRHSVSHALYWYERGLDQCEIENPTDFDERNVHRLILQSLRQLTFTGRVNLTIRPGSPNYPIYNEYPDLRLVFPTHERHCVFIDRMLDWYRENKGWDYDYGKNDFAAGHYNYLSAAIAALFADNQRQKAQALFDFGKSHYSPPDQPEWKKNVLEEFMTAYVKGALEAKAYGVTNTLLEISIKKAILAKGILKDEEKYKNRKKAYLSLYYGYQKKAVSDRTRIPAHLRKVISTVIRDLLLYPESIGVKLTPSQKSDIYLAMLAEDNKFSEPPGILAPVYEDYYMALQITSRYGGLDFEKAFPRPPFLKEYIEQKKQQIYRERRTDGSAIERDQ